MAQPGIHKLIELLMRVQRELGSACACAEVEGMAVMLHRAMSFHARRFHTLEHVFGFVEGADPEFVLAALFHDLVYYQVDSGISPEIAAIVEPYLERSAAGEIALRPAAGPDWPYELCLGVFGFAPGKVLGPFGGLNEFLSALAFARMMEGHLPRAPVAAAVVCIEASVPFRPEAREGALAEALQARLQALRTAGALEATEEELASMTRRSVAFANRDVRDFALADAGAFLSNTWKLLPESNVPLRTSGTFLAAEYRQALSRMLGFFDSLTPQRVFRSFRDSPPPAELAALRESAARNLAFAREYLRAKLFAVAIVEALAAVSGGDAPIALFMGELPERGAEPRSLVSVLRPAPRPAEVDPEGQVYRLLRDGRLEESAFDLRNSPLTLYLLHRLGAETFRAQEARAFELFAGRLGAGDFLLGLGADFAAELCRAAAEMAPTRALALAAWARGAGLGEGVVPASC